MEAMLASCHVDLVSGNEVSSADSAVFVNVYDVLPSMCLLSLQTLVKCSVVVLSHVFK